MNLRQSNYIIFFAAVVIGLFLFLARDIILRRKTSYDKEELESKKLCECAEEPVKPTVQYVTNYDEDEDCIACSA